MNLKNSITENIGGFFLNPTKYSLYFIKNLLSDDINPSDRLPVRKKAKLFVKFIGIFAGAVLTFFLMYPDVFWYVS
jgi:hypothetical protein